MSTTETRKLPRFVAPKDGRLTPDMLAAFEQSGVLILRDFATQQACDVLRERALQLVDAFDPQAVRSVFSTQSNTQQNDDYFLGSSDKIRFFLEEGALDDNGGLKQAKAHSLNKMGHALHDLDPVFEAFSYAEAIAAAVDSLGVADPAIIQSMYIFKPPKIGGEVVCHQDSTYLYTEPESCIGFWFALQDATVENGCMHFIPGAHKHALKTLHRRQADGRMATETMDDAPWPDIEPLPAEAEAGTVVIFHGRAPHLSAANHSARSRHAYTLHVIDRNSRYPRSNWLQRGAELPLRSLGAVRGG